MSLILISVVTITFDGHVSRSDIAGSRDDTRGPIRHDNQQLCYYITVFTPSVSNS